MTDTSPDAFRRTRLLQSQLPEGAVLIDQTRERTSWDEGMFVTSTHFNRDQSYVIARHSDLGRAVGAGVIDGLEVTRKLDDPTALVVAPGLGIGGGGESVVLHGKVTISLADIALQKSLTQGAGLTGSLNLIGESRTGVFVLCATPVEYTSNPVGSYATGPDGQRRLNDSVVNEATLFTLVPFTLSAKSGQAEARRALAARRVFHEGAFPDIPSTSLPLAMLELDGNVLVWLDMHLARRKAGAARADAFGMGMVDTPARAAHFAQYDAQIREMIAAQPGLSFAASDRFDILPPMGRMPAATVIPRAPAPGQNPVLSHGWLPAEMPVELTALPEDEIAQLLEESLTMPPIDLHASPEALAQTPVSIVVPIPRADWAEAPLEVVQNALTLTAAAPLGAVPRTPMDLIRGLLEQESDPDLQEPMDDAAWRELLSGHATLWYMRRRQFLRTDALTGEAYLFREGAPEDEEEEEEEPENPPEVDLGLVREVSDNTATAMARALERIGLADHAAGIQAPDTPEGHRARSELAVLIGRVIATGSEIVLADLVQRAAENGALTLSEVRRLGQQYPIDELATSFVPFEGLLLGGSVELVVPAFPEQQKGPQLDKDFMAKLNGGIPPRAEKPLPVPADMEDRVNVALEDLSMPPEVVKTVLSQGGGALPLGPSRDVDSRVRALERLLEVGVPVRAEIRDNGGLEAQTRRNLLVRSKAVPDLTRKFTKASLGDLLKPLTEHMRAMDTAFERDPDDAVRLVTETANAILRT